MHIITNAFYHISLPPLLPITVSLIAGIWWQSVDHSFAIPISLCFIIIAAIFIFIRIIEVHFFIPSNIVIGALLAFPLGAYLFQRQLNTANSCYKIIGTKPVDIRGTVKNIEITKHLRTKRCITLQIHTFKKPKQPKWKKNNNTILIYTNTQGKIQVADTISVNTILFKQPSTPSYKSYLLKQGIVAAVFANRLNYSIDHHPTWSFARWQHHQQQQLLATLERKLSIPAFTFFSSLFLGNRTRVKSNIQQTTEQFKKWGISHFLARSGLHLAIFVLIWHAIFRVVALPFMAKQIIILFLSILYYLLSWPSASFIRAFSLFILYKLCTLDRKPFHFLHLLTLVCFSFLIINPIQLFFLDFQLSFALTFALAWFNQLYGTNRP